MEKCPLLFFALWSERIVQIPLAFYHIFDLLIQGSDHLVEAKKDRLLSFVEVARFLCHLGVVKLPDAYIRSWAGIADGLPTGPLTTAWPCPACRREAGQQRVRYSKGGHHPTARSSRAGQVSEQWTQPRTAPARREDGRTEFIACPAGWCWIQHDRLNASGGQRLEDERLALRHALLCGGPAQGHQPLVADDAQGEAGQDRRQGRPALPLQDSSAGVGRRIARVIRSDPWSHSASCLGGYLTVGSWPR